PTQPRPLVPTLRVGMPSAMLCVARPAERTLGDAERPGQHSHAERGNEWKVKKPESFLEFRIPPIRNTSFTTPPSALESNRRRAGGSSRVGPRRGLPGTRERPAEADVPVDEADLGGLQPEGVGHPRDPRAADRPEVVRSPLDGRGD